MTKKNTIKGNFFVEHIWVISAVAMISLLTGATLWAVHKENPNNVTQVVPGLAELSTVDNPLDGVITLSENGVNDGSTVTENVPTVSLYYDYSCPYCKIFALEYEPSLEQAARDGKINLEFRVLSILDHYFAGEQYSTRATNASIAVLEANPDVWLSFNKLMFLNQPEGGTSLTDERIQEIGVEAGLTEEQASAITVRQYFNWIERRTDDELATDITGVPTVSVDGRMIDISGVNTDAALFDLIMVSADPENRPTENSILLDDSSPNNEVTESTETSK